MFLSRFMGELLVYNCRMHGATLRTSFRTHSAGFNGVAISVSNYDCDVAYVCSLLLMWDLGDKPLKFSIALPFV